MFASPPGGSPTSRDVDDDEPETLARNDPLATQVWRMYAKQRDQLPNAARMENLTWRLMSLTLRRQRDQKSGAATEPASARSSAPPSGPSTTTATPMEATLSAPGTTGASPASAPAARKRDLSPVEMRRGRNQTVRPLEGGAIPPRDAFVGHGRRPGLGPRSRSRSLSMMDVDRGTFARSHSRNRSMYDHAFGGAVPPAVDSIYEGHSPLQMPGHAAAAMASSVAGMSGEQHAFDHALALAHAGPHAGMGAQGAHLFDPLYAPLGSGNASDAAHAASQAAAAGAFHTPSPQASGAGSHASTAVTAPTPVSATVSGAHAGSAEHLRTSFEKAAFNNLFDSTEAHTWTAASPLEEHAHYVMAMSARRGQLPGDRDDQFLAQTTHLDSVPGIDDYVSHEANQHPEYGFLPRLVRKTSFDHKVRERSESRGPRHRTLRYEAAQEAERSNTRKRPFRDASPMPFGLRAPTTADQRMASGLSREMPSLFGTDMMQYMPSIMFDFTMPHTAHDMGAHGAHAANNADMMAHASSMPASMILPDTKGKDAAQAANAAAAAAAAAAAVSANGPETPGGMYNGDVTDLGDASKTPSMPYPMMYLHTDPHDPMANRNMSPSFMHIDPSQLLTQTPMHGQHGAQHPSAVQTPQAPPHQTPHQTPMSAHATPQHPANLAIFSTDTSFDATVNTPYHFAESPHVPPGALELNSTYSPTSAHAMGMHQGQEPFYTSVFQPVDMSRNKTWAPGAMTTGSPLGDGDGMPGTNLISSSHSDPSEAPRAYTQSPSPQKSGAAAAQPDAGAKPPSAPAGGADGTPTVCTNCQTTKTPLWRRDNEGNALCNACGLFQRLHGVMRPLSLKTDVIKKRNRSGATSTRDSARSRAGQRRSSASSAPRTHLRTAAASKADNASAPTSAVPSSTNTPMRSPVRTDTNHSASLEYQGW
ncbi:Sodium- and chloride-dependent GABA transporter 1 [Malassezia furfur]|uniref:Sodium- and chloride-dependent GABA transporter 1 n=1 Tax=Malassezia furfur TaxID=55194 RepID=A0ABY8EW97_MALFU|nr:Sodium- and chloride-dependent GABA transporter 1 [Malassezia furfur]